MRNLLIICAALTVSSVNAQGTYTEKLRKTEAGQGKIIINQSADIEHIVNHGNPPAPKKAQTAHTNEAATAHHTADPNPPLHKADYTGANGTHVKRARYKARGFRICIFTGGNSRADKAKAQQMGEKCRKKFPELAVYPNFVPPRWVTYVGDFKTREEAQKYVSLIRRAHFTYEVRIVGSEVNLPY